MEKDNSDRSTRDILRPNPHGGYRPGAGRKKGAGPAKKKLGWNVSVEAIENITAIIKGE